MKATTEAALEKGIKYALAFSEVIPPYGNQQDIDTFQMNPFAKATFSIARVTFEVRAFRGASGAGVTLVCLALEGTE